MCRIPTFALIVTVALLWPSGPRTARAADVDYLTQIKPLLTEKCYSCHGVLKQESSLRLETRELMLQGGDSGEVIVPGEPEQSLLIERIRSSDSDRMPPHEEGSALTADQIQLVETWIRQGAESPPESIPVGPEQHWAFQPVVRPKLPPKALAAHPIDALLEAKLASQSIRPQPAALRSLQIRRLYLDLLGLPPTAQQLADPRPWSQIVDELLSNPHHGERWARHWMDIWRYSDWYGLGAQLRNSQKHLWHWRDWIVDSLNHDKGYDRMVLEMVAGDELAPDDPSVLAATGYLARNYYLFNRTTWLDSTIEHTSKAFLGLTINCAKCHDHKYDPITQDDYYRLRAIFEPHQVRLDPVPGVVNFEEDGLPRVFDDDVAIATYLHVRGDPKNPDESRKITPGVPAILEHFAPTVQPVDLPVAAYAPGVRDYVRRDRVQIAKAAVRSAEQELAEAQRKLKEQLSAAKDAEKVAETPNKSFTITDDFEHPREELWEIVGDGWQYRDGALHQTMAARDSQMIRLLTPLPRDFEVECRYTTTGGTTYKSVSFRFDQSVDGQDFNQVYTSAHAPGPKVQAAFARNGETSYPPEGRRGEKIEVGKQYTLRFAVRGTLINVWLNDEFMLAYRFPDRREGFLSLSGFDATVAFDSIRIGNLDATTELKESTKPGDSAPTRDVREVVSLAQAKLNMSKAALRSVQATCDADYAKFFSEDDGEKQRLASLAAQRQAELRVAKAKHQVLVDAGDDKKLKLAKEELEAATQVLLSMNEESHDEVREGDLVRYESIRGAKKALESPAHKESDYPTSYSPISTGRRLALARWITARENPLTARVAVNHVWMRHFGSPLVESVFDFGLRAPQPEHAELLDFLASELMESGWSLKHLHRLIVTSQAYRRSTSSVGADDRCLQQDPTNKFYWRMNSRRMESQLLRDSLLAFADHLDGTFGGPVVNHQQQPPRRSLYLRHSLGDQDKFLEMFDNADVLACYRRSESIVPQQALAMTNSELSLKMAGRIADRISADLEKPDRDSFIAAVFQTLLARPATEEEAEECERFLAEIDRLSAQQEHDPSRGLARLVHAILNHNDFITIR